MTSGKSALSAAGGLGGGLLTASPFTNPFISASFLTDSIAFFGTAFFTLKAAVFDGAVLGGAAFAVMRLLARSLLCLSSGVARGNGLGALVLVAGAGAEAGARGKGRGAGRVMGADRGAAGREGAFASFTSPLDSGFRSVVFAGGLAAAGAGRGAGRAAAVFGAASVLGALALGAGRAAGAARVVAGAVRAVAGASRAGFVATPLGLEGAGRVMAGGRACGDGFVAAVVFAVGAALLAVGVDGFNAAVGVRAAGVVRVAVMGALVAGGVLVAVGVRLVGAAEAGLFVVAVLVGVRAVVVVVFGADFAVRISGFDEGDFLVVVDFVFAIAAIPAAAPAAATAAAAISTSCNFVSPAIGVSLRGAASRVVEHGSTAGVGGGVATVGG